MAKKNIIALVDCDSFFVSVEQAINPDLKNKPVCVLSNNDGCVVSRSKEAKQMGVRMGMPLFQAKREFPNCIYQSSHFDSYLEYSKKVMDYLKSVSPDVEVCSVDEAYIDLTGLTRSYKMNYGKIAQHIRKELKELYDIPVSIGLSTSKALAKLASDKAKTHNGLYIIGNRKLVKELKNTRIEEICGVGHNTMSAMHKLGIYTADKIVERTDAQLQKEFNIKIVELKHELLGEMVSKVTNQPRIPQSIQDTSSFPQFTTDKNYIINALNFHIHKSCTKLRKINGVCHSISVILKTKDFRVFTDRKFLTNGIDFELEISNIARKLLDNIYETGVLYRSCGIMLDKFSFNNSEQLYLFEDTEEALKQKKLTTAIDNIETKFGKNSIKTGF